MRFNLAQGSHQSEIDKVRNEQEPWDGRKRLIESATRDSILLELKRKEQVKNNLLNLH